MAAKKEMQEILDKAQVEAAPYFKDRANIVEYCNACINSGLGALEGHYGKDSAMADIGAYTVLSVWIETVKGRLEKRLPDPARH